MVFWQVGQPPCTAAWPYMANVQSCAFLSWRWVNWRSNCSQRLTCCRRQWLRIAERLATLLPCHSTICIYISSVIPSCWWVVLGWSIVHDPPTAIPTTIHGTRRESFLRALCMAVSWQRAAGRNALNRSARLWKWQVRPCSVWMAIGSTPCKRLNLGSSRASHAFMWLEVGTPNTSSAMSKSSTTTAAWPWGCTLSWDLWLRPPLLPTSSAWRRTRNQLRAWCWRMSRRAGPWECHVQEGSLQDRIKLPCNGKVYNVQDIMIIQCYFVFMGHAKIQIARQTLWRGLYSLKLFCRADFRCFLLFFVSAFKCYHRLPPKNLLRELLSWVPGMPWDFGHPTGWFLWDWRTHDASVESRHGWRDRDMLICRTNVYVFRIKKLSMRKEHGSK